MVSNSSDWSGMTLSRDCLTRAIVANDGSALIVANETGCFNGRTGTKSTQTQSPESDVGSG